MCFTVFHPQWTKEERKTSALQKIYYNNASSTLFVAKFYKWKNHSWHRVHLSSVTRLCLFPPEEFLTRTVALQTELSSKTKLFFFFIFSCYLSPTIRLFNEIKASNLGGAGEAMAFVRIYLIPLIQAAKELNLCCECCYHCSSEKSAGN